MPVFRYSSTSTMSMYSETMHILQTFSKMGAHYHCIICSATITRRTDMIGHINRHVNKGETESRFITSRFLHKTLHLFILRSICNNYDRWVRDMRKILKQI